ncbi:MAG: DNA polymerase Y family protein [Thiotrichales bacterium]
MLWLALDFHALSLDLITRGEPAAGALPLATFTQSGNRQRIVLANRAARSLGVQAGMPLAAALSLAENLRTGRHDPAAEQAALQQLAAWTLQFTPTLSLQPPTGLLLEIGGCVGLFGGIEKIIARVAEGVGTLGFQVRHGCAPTPLAAWWLARVERTWPVTTQGALEAALATLPLGVLEVATETRQRLLGLGLETLGDCLRLPRAGLARRLGPALVGQLDRALGRAPDPRHGFVARPRFDSRIQLPEPVDSTEPLLFVLRRLLLELSGFLRGRGGGALELKLRLSHPGRTSTLLTLGLLAPSREVEHLLALWREKLERHQLIAPIEGLRLCVEHLAPLTELTPDLLQTEARGGVDFIQLMERLRGRLGPAALRTLISRADHRPEQAWRQVESNTPEPPATPCKLRPLWLLKTPHPLETRDGQPHLDGALVMLQGPERIESGWWDGNDMRRDYYLAESVQKQRLWIFQTFTRPPSWYLHGLFA